MTHPLLITSVSAVGLMVGCRAEQTAVQPSNAPGLIDTAQQASFVVVTPDNAAPEDSKPSRQQPRRVKDRPVTGMIWHLESR